MSNHRGLQTNRFELKYIIDEQRARGIRDYLRGYMEPDEHVRDHSTCSYPVFSLYLDTPTLALYRQTIQGLKNRFKLRIRFYDDIPTSPAFLEIKRRLTDVVRKERAALCKEGVCRLLNGARPDLSHVIQSNGHGNGLAAMDRFCSLREEIGARGAAYVFYNREAYVSPGSDNLRVTFDRELQGDAFGGQTALSPPTQGITASVGGVVLEIKFVDRFPRWMQDMAWAFDLQRCSMPKYIHCVDALGLSPSRWLDMRPELMV